MHIVSSIKVQKKRNKSPKEGATPEFFCPPTAYYTYIDYCETEKVLRVFYDLFYSPTKQFNSVQMSLHPNQKFSSVFEFYILAVVQS